MIEIFGSLLKSWPVVRMYGSNITIILSIDLILYFLLLVTLR